MLKQSEIESGNSEDIEEEKKNQQPSANTHCNIEL